MTGWEPDPDAELVDGCRVRIGGGPHEGKWTGLSLSKHYRGNVRLDDGGGWIDVPVGCPVTVLREVRPLVDTTVTIRLPVGRDDAILDDIADCAIGLARRRGIDVSVAAQTLPVPATPGADR